MSWISIQSVVAGDLNGDAKADREASEPSVSEVTATPASMAANTGKGSSAKSAANSTAARAQGASGPRDAASGLPTGKRMHKPFVIMKELDKASPKLYEACASGQHLKEVDVDLAGGGQFKLYDVVISSDQKSASNERPTETITFNYTKIELAK